jgi:hypothetical protein
MVQLRYPGLLLAIAAFLGPVLAATCTKTVVARAGDTCATVSVANALTVSQFIQLNPTLATCSLVPGTVYCVSVDPAAITTTPPRTTSTPPAPTSSGAAPTSSLIPSPDGSDGVCGGGYTCLGSVYGDCCSEVGYCGNTTEYCGEGCNPVFGKCGGGIPVDEPGAPAATVTVTVTGPITCSAGTVTRTITQLVTVSQTVTKLQTVTQTVTTATSAAPRPSPTLGGTARNCELESA